jgi:hypothetical protein
MKNKNSTVAAEKWGTKYANSLVDLFDLTTLFNIRKEKQP